jgi:hypothetical protein
MYEFHILNPLFALWYHTIQIDNLNQTLYTQIFLEHLQVAIMNFDTEDRQQAWIRELTKISLQGTGLERVLWIHLAQDRYQ